MDLGTFTIQKNYSLSPSLTPSITSSALHQNSDGTYSTTAPYSTGVAAIMKDADVPVNTRQAVTKNLTNTYGVSTQTQKKKSITSSHSSQVEKITFSRKAFPKESSFLYTNTVKNPSDHYSTTTSRMAQIQKNSGVVSTSFAGTKNVHSGVENAQRVTTKGGSKGPKSVLKIIGGENPSISGVNKSEQIVKKGFVRNDVVGLISVYETSNNNTRLCSDNRDRGNGNLIKSVIAITNNGKSYRIGINNNNNNDNHSMSNIISDNDSTDGDVSTVFYYHTASVYALAVEKNIPQYEVHSSNVERTFFATGGDDKWLQIWCSKKREMIVRVRTDKPIKCLDFDTNNNYIAVGYNNGSFGIYEFVKTEIKNRLLTAQNNRNANSVVYSLLTACENVGKLKEEISDIKFSPNNKMIAVASHDDVIDMYVLTIIFYITSLFYKSVCPFFVLLIFLTYLVILRLFDFVHLVLFNYLFIIIYHL